MGAWQWVEWTIAVLLVGGIATVAVNVMLRKAESGTYRDAKASVRRQASVHASSHSDDDLSKNE